MAKIAHEQYASEKEAVRVAKQWRHNGYKAIIKKDRFGYWVVMVYV